MRYRRGFCYFCPRLCGNRLGPVRVPGVRTSKGATRVLSELFSASATICPRGCVFFSDMFSFRNNTPINRLRMVGGMTTLIKGRGLVIGIRPHSSVRQFTSTKLGISGGSTVP